MKQHWLRPNSWDHGYTLLCPTCHFDHSHHGTVTEYRREQEDGPTTAYLAGGPGFASTSNPSDRRGAVSIYIEGECGHNWKLNVVQHKGQTYLEAVAES